MPDFKDILAVPDHGAQDILEVLTKSNPQGINQYTKGGGATGHAGNVEQASEALGAVGLKIGMTTYGSKGKLDEAHAKAVAALKGAGWKGANELTSPDGKSVAYVQAYSNKVYLNGGKPYLKISVLKE
jgi:hypothetical protein